MDTTRDRILGAARELFGERGYDGTSLRDLAERLGFSKAALYHHFQSKEQILEALVEPLLALQAEMARRADLAESVEQWGSLVEWVIDGVLDNSDMFTFFERNRAAVVAVMERSDAFGGAKLNQRVGEAVDRVGASLPQKVRLAAALSSIVGFEGIAPKVFLAADRDDLRTELIALTRDILGLPARDASGIGARQHR